MKRTILALMILAVPTIASAASKLLDADRATDSAVAILKGDPYGNTKAEIARTFKSQILVIKGNDPCSDAPVKAPAWTFWVETFDQNSRDESGQPSKINGFLTIDATTGKRVCAGLPFLD